MQKLLFRFMAVFLALFSLAANAASELQNYVQQCQNELQFKATEVPALDCGQGLQFATGRATPVSDVVFYKRINDTVDLTFACRWLNVSSPIPLVAASVELLIHNRQNGSTCFFSAKDTGAGDASHSVSGAIVSPTNFNNTYPNANDYWLQPKDLDSKQLASQRFDGTSGMDSARCVGCHVAGPYIASPDIAPYLARFGLLNDGHDTIADMTAAKHYHAVGSSAYNNPMDGTNASVFKAWDNIVYKNMIDAYINGTATNTPDGKADPDCSGPCHSIAENSKIGTLFLINDNRARLLPSIEGDIAMQRAAMPTIPDADLMPPFADNSDYHWINSDTPGSDGVDIETFTASKNRFPVVAFNCGVPTNLEAHAVGSDVNFSTAEMSLIPDKLKSFNLRDGLVCLNADQGAGKKCYDYAVSYECSNGNWTPFYNNDKPNSNANDDGDHEERSTVNSLVLYTCGSAPVGIQAQVLASGGFPIAQVKGPNDKLQQFAPSGLICKNSDQSSGQCSNYVVRYSSCISNSQATLSRIKNEWVNLPTFTNRFLTTTNNVNGAETRAQGENTQYPSQDWIIETISDSTVRLKDVWSGKYLTASSNNNLATVVVNDSNASLTRQQWVIVTIANSNDVHIRNVGSGGYLTVGNYTTDPYYAPVISQALSNQNWTSQRWVIQ